jgi:hypothetical protein
VNLDVRGNYTDFSGGGGGSGALVNIFSNSTAAINAGGELSFGGMTGNGSPTYPFAGIKGAKQGAAGNGNYDGYMSFYTTNQAGYFTEGMRLTGGGAGSSSTGVLEASNGTSLQPICLADGTGCPAYALLASPALTGTPTAPTASTATTGTQLATLDFVHNNVNSFGYLTSVSWSIQPVLFSTSTMLGPVYFTTYIGSIIPTMIARLSGAISCTSAPVINFMDLGTSPTTSYGSATSLGSLTTGTSDGVYGSGTHNLGEYGLTVNHYYGIGFSAGTCVTAPTIDVSVYATW